MRPSTWLPTLILGCLHSTTANMNNAFARSFSLLAEMGLNPDGTPISSSSGATFRIKSISESIEPEYIELPIDNFAPSKNQAYAYHGTFYNRYWVSSRAYKPGSPIFIYDVGESDASTNALFRLTDDSSFFRQLVEQYNGIGIVWEHRFYGNSSPTPVDVNTPPEDFTFLTTEQSLADVDRFAWQFSRPNINYTLTPAGSPWIFVGGSYPGMRAAFMRQHYPDTIFAAYASSAPVQAAIDQSSYYEPMWAGLNKYGFGNCTRDIQAAVRWMDGVMERNQTRAREVKRMFLGKGAEGNSHETFADALSTIFAAWMSYGVEGGVLGLRRFCDWIETDTDGMKPVLAGKDGWGKTKGAEWVVARWASYPWFAGNVNQYLETECSGRDDVAGTCDLNNKFSEPNVIAWTWQYCTEWGESSYPFPSSSPTHAPPKQASSNPQTSVTIKSYPNSIPSRTGAHSAHANFPRAIFYPCGLTSLAQTASSAVGQFGPPTRTGPTANSIPGARYRPPMRPTCASRKRCPNVGGRRRGVRCLDIRCGMHSIVMISGQGWAWRGVRSVGSYLQMR
jgi:hypothetical protein